jgi:hypothetical protein
VHVFPAVEILAEREAHEGRRVRRAASGRRYIAKMQTECEAQRAPRNGIGVKPPVHLAAEVVGRFVQPRPRRASDLLRRDLGTWGETEHAPPPSR